jgi:hypothetical protein
MTSLIADMLDRLDVELRYQFEERAGTIEFDCQQTRDQAEVLALVDLLRSHPGALVGVTTYEIERDGRIVVIVTTTTYATPISGSLLRTVDLAEVISTRFGGIAVVGPFG